MSFSIIDKNTKEVIQGGFPTENAALDALIDNGATDEEIANIYDVVLESTAKKGKPRKTTYEERKEYFGDGASGVLAEIFPNLAEQNMRGNNVEFNLGRNNGDKNFDMVRAGIADVFSLPGRLFSTVIGNATENISNAPAIIAGEKEYSQPEFDLGRRQGEETNFAGDILRDPITFATIPLGGVLAKGVGVGANAGSKVLGGTAGRIAGGATAGAGEGVAIEGASSIVNDKEFSPVNAAVAGITGGIFEGAGQAIQQLLQYLGKKLVRSSVAALMKGNVKAHVTDEEMARFLSNPNNMDALVTLLDQQSTGRNVAPFLGGSDRGKTLQTSVDNAIGEAKSTIKNEPMLNDGDMGLELYDFKTLAKPGSKNLEERNYLRDIYPEESELPLARQFKSKKKLTKDFGYQSKAEYDLEKFADKYAGTVEALNMSGPKNRLPMTPDEREFIDFLMKEIEKDGKVLDKYNFDYVKNSNKFFQDRMPFSNAELARRIDALKESHASGGFSQEFIDKVGRLQSDATDRMGQKVADAINKDFAGRWNELERAFAYADPQKKPPMYVRKGLRDPLDKFADALDKEALGGVGKWRKNSDGKMYFLKKNNSYNYDFDYLNKIQQTLENVENNRHLNPEDIVGLFSEATMKNDKAVQDAIITLLEDMKLSKGAIDAFKAKAGNYSMLYKAREALKTNPQKDSRAKGTMFNFLVPQEGFNFGNALGYRTQGKNINLRDLSTRNDPTAGGNLARQIMLFDLGFPFNRSVFGKSEDDQ